MGISDPDRIRVGERLTIPGESAAPASTEGYHWVDEGETLDAIAASYGISVETLKAANGLEGSKLYAGIRLRLSGQGFVAEPGSGTTDYEVVAGDTLASIAARHNVSQAALVAVNDIHDPNRIVVGTVLHVPSATWICPRPRCKLLQRLGLSTPGRSSSRGDRPLRSPRDRSQSAG